MLNSIFLGILLVVFLGGVWFILYTPQCLSCGVRMQSVGDDDHHGVARGSMRCSTTSARIVAGSPSGGIPSHTSIAPDNCVGDLLSRWTKHDPHGSSTLAGSQGAVARPISRWEGEVYTMKVQALWRTSRLAINGIDAHS
jgi:hypothetical protein